MWTASRPIRRWVIRDRRPRARALDPQCMPAASDRWPPRPGARNHGLLPSASGRPVQLSKSVRSPGSLAETLCTPAGRTADLKRNPIACRWSQRGRADFRHGMVRWWLPPTHSSWGCRDVCVSTVSIVIRRDRRVLCRMRNSQFDATIVATISSRPRWMVLIRWSGRC